MSNADPPAGLDRALSVVAEAYAAVRESPGDSAALKRSVDRLGEIELGAAAELRAPLQYHRARMLAASGDKSGAMRLLDSLLAADRPRPETLWLKIQLTHVEGDAASNQARWALEDRLGAELPISPWGQVRDGKLEELEAAKRGVPLRDNPDVPIIPLVEYDKLRRIAVLLEDMNLAAEAAAAYEEALYGGVAPPAFPVPGDPSWLGDSAGDTWMSVGRCAVIADRRDAAAHALLMAVATSKSRLRRAVSLAEQVGRPSASTQLQPSRTMLLEVAELYRGLNLHPRAIEAIDRAAKTPGPDLAGLRRDVDESWRHMIDEYSNGRTETCFLFGMRVADVRDRLTLTPRRHP